MSEAEQSSREGIPRCHDFHIAMICALAREADAVEALFEHIWETDEIIKNRDGEERYTLGLIRGRLVVLLWLRGVRKLNAGMAAKGMKRQFKNVKHAMLVGVCGGVPYATNPITGHRYSIVLGDVIISTAVHKYDEGKILEIGHEYVAGPQVVPDNKDVIGEYLDRVTSSRRSRATQKNNLEKNCAFNLKEIFTQKDYPDMQYPGATKDILYPTQHIHKHYDASKCVRCQTEVCRAVAAITCESLRCGKDHLIARERLDEIMSGGKAKPQVFFGPIGSADQVVRSGARRDELAKQEKIIGIEMEGAGICEVFQDFVVIKSVCDYADSHKNKDFQPYAAATAAACAKAFLEAIERRIPQWKKEHKILKLIPGHGLKARPAAQSSKQHTQHREDPEEVKRFTQRYDDGDPRLAKVVDSMPESDGLQQTIPRGQDASFSQKRRSSTSIALSQNATPENEVVPIQKEGETQSAETVLYTELDHPTSPGTAKPLDPWPSLGPQISPEQGLKEGERVVATKSKAILVVDSETHKPLGEMSISVQEIAGPSQPMSDTNTPAYAVSQPSPLPIAPREPVEENLEDPKQTEDLRKACKDTDVEKVHELLKNPSSININAPNDKGKSMLHLALGTSRAGNAKAQMDRSNIVRALCVAGADVEQRDRQGMAPIHLCGKYMNSDAAMTLLDYDADPNLGDRRGLTALYHIALDNDPDAEFARKLIERGGTLARKTLPELQERSRINQVEVRNLIDSSNL